MADVTIQARVAESTALAILDLASMNRISKSEIIRQAIDYYLAQIDYFKKWGDPKPPITYPIGPE